MKSISNDQRLLLLENTKVLLYTPENEHFGIVPVEAMHIGCVVIACNSGGPLESVDDGNTGFLIRPSTELWGEKIYELLKPGSGSEAQILKMREASKNRVKRLFVMDVFARDLDKIMQSMRDSTTIGYWAFMIALVSALAAVSFAVLHTLVTLM